MIRIRGMVDSVAHNLFRLVSIYAYVDSPVTKNNVNWNFFTLIKVKQIIWVKQCNLQWILLQLFNCLVLFTLNLKFAFTENRFELKLHYSIFFFPKLNGHHWHEIIRNKKNLTHSREVSIPNEKPKLYCLDILNFREK